LSGGAGVTISSLNLHCGLSGQGQPFDVPAALARLDADIIAVQEAWWTGRGRGSDAVAAASGALGTRLIRTDGDQLGRVAGRAEHRPADRAR